MSYSHGDIITFYDLFKSNPSAYGTTIVGDIVDGKAKSTSSLVHSELTVAVISHHLSGEYSIGAAPLLPNDNVRWCAIDIDDYTGDLMNIVAAIEDLHIPLLPCLSKSRKLHIYCFFSEEVPAIDAQELMRAYLVPFRCSPKTEIFPKQNHTSINNKFYSWINLPYFAAESDNHRKNIIGQNTYRSLTDFLEVAQERQLTYKEHMAALKSLPYYGAPPCVFSGAVLRDVGPGIRNQWFYNVACYLRMNDENIDLEEPLLQLNDTMKQPLPEREITTTVSKVASKSYFYQCSNMLGCNKAACKTTDLGINNTTKSTGFSFGQLTKIKTDPIQWKWEINGSDLIFHSTDAIMQQNNFRRLCMEKLNQIPHKVTDDKWTSILKRALETVVEEDVDIRGDFGKGSQFLEVLAAFFAGGRSRALNLSQVNMGKVYLDPVTQRFVFSANALRTYMNDKHKLDLDPNEIRERIVAMGATMEGGFWTLPVKDAPVYVEPKIEIDYHNTEGYEDGGMQF